MSKQSVLVVGSINADIILDVDRLPRRGETVATRQYDSGMMVPGGKGANQAVAVARMKITTRFCGCFGTDFNATALKKALEEHDIDLSLSQMVEGPSGQAFIFLEPDGSNSIVISGGSNRKWPSPLSDKLVHAIKEASIILLQREIPDTVNLQVLQIARAAGVPVVLDPGGEDTLLPGRLLHDAAIICPNETELERLIGKSVRTVDDAILAAYELQAQGAKSVLVTLGAMGAVFIPDANTCNGKGAAIFHPSAPVSHVVDTTGAGDCYRAVFSVAFINGTDIPQCMARATAACGLCIQRKGAMSSMPSLEEVEDAILHLPNESSSM